MLYSCEKNLDGIFDMPFLNSAEEVFRNFKNKNIAKYRLKSIFSGNTLESEAYPVWNTKPAEIREQEKSITTEKQAQLNYQNKRKNFMRLLNANFTKDDLHITLGYKNALQPADEAAAKKDLVNYIRRLQRYVKKHDLPKLKYLYVIETSVNGFVHHHLIINFANRDMAESMWHCGEYPKADRLKPNDFGLKGLAFYLTKETRGKKSYGNSLGLHRSWLPGVAKVADNKISRTRAKKIATEQINVREFYEKLYPGYAFVNLVPQTSPFTDGIYLYATLRKKTPKELELEEKIKKQKQRSKIRP